MSLTDAEYERAVNQLPKQARALLWAKPEVGQRHDSLAKLAYWGAEYGLTNTEVLEVLDSACLSWEKYPATYERWTKLLGLLRTARKKYPNGPRGRHSSPEPDTPGSQPGGKA